AERVRRSVDAFRMAAVDDDGRVRAPRGDLADEQGEFLVEQVRHAAVPAVDAEHRLHHPGGLDVRQAGWYRCLRAVPAEPEQRRVAGAGLTEMAAERVDYGGAGRVTVEQRQRVQVPLLDAALKVLRRVLDVVAAASQRRDRLAIGVDADEQSVDGHGSALLTISGAGAVRHRPGSV